MSQGPTLSGELMSTVSSRARTLATALLSCFSSQRSWCANLFPNKSTNTLDFSSGWDICLKGPRIAADAFGPSHFIRNFPTVQSAWGVIPKFPTFLPTFQVPFSKSFLILAVLLVTQLTAVLHTGSLVSCHNFPGFRLFNSSGFKPGRSVFASEWVCLWTAYMSRQFRLRDRGLHCQLQSELIWILGEINSVTKFWNRSQSAKHQ
jgi:hypothetical protein